MNDKEQNRLAIAQLNFPEQEKQRRRDVPKKPTRKASIARPREAAGEPPPLDHPTNWMPFAEITSRSVSALALLALRPSICGNSSDHVGCKVRRPNSDGHGQRILSEFWPDLKEGSAPNTLKLKKRRTVTFEAAAAWQAQNEAASAAELTKLVSGKIDFWQAEIASPVD